MTTEEAEALEKLYRTTKDVRLRTRANHAASWGAAHDRSDHCCQRARSKPNGAKLAHVLDGQRYRRTQRSVHGRRLRRKSVRSRKSNCLPPSGVGLTAWDNPLQYGRGSRLSDSMAEHTGVRASYQMARLVRHPPWEIVLSRSQHTVSSPDRQVPGKKRRSKRRETG